MKNMTNEEILEVLDGEEEFYHGTSPDLPLSFSADQVASVEEVEVLKAAWSEVGCTRMVRCQPLTTGREYKHDVIRTVVVMMDKTRECWLVQWDLNARLRKLMPLGVNV